jgi:hypothetical protein
MSFFTYGFEKRATERLVGGKADGKPDSKFDKKQIEVGIKVEREHIKDKEARKEVAKDHLTEDPKYYSHLKEMESKYVKKAGVLKGLASGLLGVSEFSGEQIARKAGTGVRRAIVPASAAGGTAVIMKKTDEKKEGEKTAFVGGVDAAALLRKKVKHL